VPDYFDSRRPETLTRLITETKTTKITMPHPDVIGWCKNSPIFCRISWNDIGPTHIGFIALKEAPAHWPGMKRRNVPLGAYLIRTAERGLLDSAKVLLFVANLSTRGCDTELLRYALSQALTQSRWDLMAA
jgi:hypothetical protein